MKQRCPLWGFVVSILSIPFLPPVLLTRVLSWLEQLLLPSQRTDVRSAQRLVPLCDTTWKHRWRKHTNVIVTLSNGALILYILSSVCLEAAWQTIPPCLRQIFFSVLSVRFYNVCQFIKLRIRRKDVEEKKHSVLWFSKSTEMSENHEKIKFTRVNSNNPSKIKLNVCL